MFEKEAEEWAKEHEGEYISDLMNLEASFRNGAEFGYNKANEWHYPKEKLPTKDCEVLIEYDDHKIHRVVDWDNKVKHFGGFSIDEVTRWKEIVLPELPKESE